MSRFVTLAASGSAYNNSGVKWKNHLASDFGSSDVVDLSFPYPTDPNGASVGSGLAGIEIDVATYALASSERVAGMRIVVQELHNVGRCKHAVLVAGNSTLSYFTTLTTYSQNTNGYVMFYGPTVRAELVQADVDALRAYLTTDFSSGFVIVQYVAVQIVVQTKPSPVPSVVIGQDGRSSSGPSISWGYSGDKQNSYHVKIFDDSVATGVGFDPETSTAVYDSGVVRSGANSMTVPFGTLDDDIDYAVCLKVANDFNSADWSSDWSAYVQFSTRPASIMVITRANPVTDTSTPNFTIGYVGSGADLSSQFVIKVFSEAQYTALGFDPESSQPVTSETVNEITNSIHWVTPIPMTNDVTYRLYVKGKSNNYGEFSPWNSATFTMDLTTADTPIAGSATVDEANATVTVEWSKDAGQEAYEPVYWVVNKSCDGGETWQDVLGSIAGAGSGPFSIVDQDPCPGTLVTYHVYAASDYLGPQVLSDPLAITCTPDLTHVWLKRFDPTDDNMLLNVQGNWMTITSNRSDQILSPLGSDLPKVLSSSGRFESMSIDFFVVSQEGMSKAVGLLDSGDTLILISGKKTRYVRRSGSYTMVESIWDELRGSDEQIWKISVPLVQVDRPTDA